MKTKAKRIWNIITSILVGVMVVLAILLWGVRLFGMQVYVVQSGSMEPVHPVGSLVYVRPVDAGQLEVGDVITFRLSGDTLATHRIVEVSQQDGRLCFRTKGDANEHEDSGYVLPENIVGRVSFSIPLLGYLVAYIQQPHGRYAAFAVVALILVMIILPDVIFDDRKSHHKNRRNQNEKNP